jgi:hypothetical protein
LAHHAVQGVDRFATRDLASVVASHAVGDHVQAETVVREERVLIRETTPSDVGEAEGNALHDRPTIVDFLGRPCPLGTHAPGSHKAVEPHAHPGIYSHTPAPAPTLR